MTEHMTCSLLASILKVVSLSPVRDLSCLYTSGYVCFGLSVFLSVFRRCFGLSVFLSVFRMCFGLSVFLSVFRMCFARLLSAQPYGSRCCI